MKRFTHRNEGFKCEHCGAQVPYAAQTCRNHCTHCLHSKHVDINPGDRANPCGGLLKPELIEIKGGIAEKIVFRCVKCDFVGRNKIAPDDDRQKLIETMERSAFV